MVPLHHFSIFPAGDTAITLECSRTIDRDGNAQVHACCHYLRKNPIPGVLDCIPGYGSLTLYYDPCFIKKKINPAGTVYEWMSARLQLAWETCPDPGSVYYSGERNKRRIRLPVCYDPEFGPDQVLWQERSGMDRTELIRLHTGHSYFIYMIGFLPGFPYMGELDNRLFMPRKEIPVEVEHGSVGIAGLQTGIYPINSPGGWNIIGRTPVALFDPGSDPPALLSAGDEVEFYAVSREEYEKHARVTPGRTEMKI